MKVKFNEQDVDRILKNSHIKGDCYIAPDFTSKVMAKIRYDSLLPAKKGIFDTISENIYLKFMLGTSAVAAASLILAIGIISQSTFTFEEYAVADYIMNVI